MLNGLATVFFSNASLLINGVLRFEFTCISGPYLAGSF